MCVALILETVPNVASEDQSSPMSQNLLIRLVTSLIAMPIVLVLLLVGGLWFALLCYAVVLIGTLEYAMMTTHHHWNATVGISIGMALGVCVGISMQSAPIAVGALVVGTLLLGAGVVASPPDAMRSVATRFGTLWLLTLYMGVMGGCAILLRRDDAGLLWWLLMLTTTWGMDIFSYVGGRAYGKRPLAPQLSPHKTVEGAITGVVGAVVISVLFMAWFRVVSPVSVFITVGAPVAALLGDLLESWVKRRFNVKDSHVHGFNVLPGHGGVLDRIDSLMLVILFCFVVVAGAALLGVMA